MLRGEQNRIQQMLKAKKYSLANEAMKDAEGCKKATINDFTDHFTFCPVYYFLDSTLDYVIQKDFKGNLFNADGSEVLNPVIENEKSNYLILYSGFPDVQPRNASVCTDSLHLQSVSDQPFGRGLIANNHKFQQIGYIYKFGYQNFWFRLFYNKKYIYASKTFDIEYFPLADRLNKQLTDYQNRVKIQHAQPLLEKVFD
jgi:hypothetical protein